MKRRHLGFTLIELMVTVAIVVVLTSLAVPSFRTMLVKRAVVAAAETLVSDMRYARSEALKRTTPVSICQSTDGASCSATAGAWKSGWIVFIDSSGDGALDAGDEIIRVQQGFNSIQSIASGSGSDKVAFTYQVTGLAKASTQTFIFTPTGTVPLNGTRLVCISMQGRPALRAQGASSCT